MKILILLGFVTFAFTKEQGNQLDCAIKGPKFWCQSEATAKQCHAVKYCTKYEWAKEKLVTSPDEDTCSYCQSFVNTLHILLLNNETQTELIAVMKYTCNLLPESTKDICASMIQLYGVQVVTDVLKYTEDAKRVCTMVNLCTSDSKRVPLNNFMMMKKVIVDKVFTERCIPCKEYIIGLHSITSSQKTKSDLVGAMRNMCQFLPAGISTLCPVMVDAMGAKIVDSVFDYTRDPSIFCAAVGMCKNRDRYPLVGHIPEVLPSKPQEKKPAYIQFAPEVSPECKYCEQIIGTFHMLLENTQTQAEVIAGLDAICETLPSIGKMCEEVVQIYSKQIIAKILEYTKNPTTICTLIHMCSAGSQPAVLDNLLEMKKLIADKVQGDHCIPCKQYVSGLHYSAMSKKTKSDLVDGMKLMCKFVPSGASSWCIGMVNAKGEQILDSFIEYTKDPSRFCDKLNLCKRSDSHPVAPVPQVLPGKIIWKHAVKEKNGVTCDLCEMAMGTLENMLKQNKSEAYVKKELEQLCNHLPELLKGSCDQMVDKYGDQIIRLIIGEMEPSEICRELGLCESSKKAVAVPKFGVSCAICEYAIQIIYSSLADKPTEARIKKALLGLCNKFPSKKLQDECTDVITTYYDELSNAVLKLLQQPALICKLAHCANSNTKAFHIQEGVICDTCIQGLTYTKTLLQSNKTKEMFICALDQVCKMTPFPDECKEIATKYATGVIDVLVDRLSNPEQICKQFYLCSSTRKESTPKMPRVSVKDGPICIACEMGVKYVAEYFNRNGTKEAVKKTVLQICTTMLPATVQGQCKALVAQYFDLAYNTVIMELKDPHALCTDIQMCSSSGKKSTTKMQRTLIKDGALCEACEMFVEYGAKYLAQNGTKAEVKNAVLSACNLLPVSFQAECQTLVGQYFDIVYMSVIERLEDPEAICTAIQMCSGKGKASTSISLKDGPVCEVCEMAARYIETLLSKNDTKSEIKEYILSACTTLPSSLADQCKQAIGLYFDLGYAFLLQQLESPLNLCKAFSMCTSSVKVSDTSMVKKSNGITCEVCELLLQKLDNMLKGNRTKQKVEDALHQLCNDLPFSSQCKSLVDTYADQILDLLVTELKDTSTVCRSLGLCASAKVRSKSSFTCEICDRTLSELGTMLDSSRNRKVVIRALQHVCARLPMHLNTECNDLVTFYAPQMLKYIAGELKDPKNFCKDLKFCAKKVVFPSKGVRKHSRNGFVTCEFCLLSMDELLKQVNIEGKRTEAEISKALDTLCSALPYGKRQCKHLVNKYSEKITNMILGGVGDSNTICKKLHYCDAPKKVIRKEEHERKRMDGNTAECSLCMFMTGKLDVRLNKDSSKKMIKTTIKSICAQAKLSNEKKDVCERMMDEYKDTMVKLVKKGKLSSLCKKLGNCESRHAVDYSAMSKFSAAVRQGGGVRCLACEYIVGVLDTYLNGKAAKQKIIVEVQSVCKKLPRPIFVTECNALITQYGEELIGMFVDNILAPVDVCKSFALC